MVERSIYNAERREHYQTYDYALRLYIGHVDIKIIVVNVVFLLADRFAYKTKNSTNEPDTDWKRKNEFIFIKNKS